MTKYWRQFRRWLHWRLGYRVITSIGLDPPNELITQLPDGTWVKPASAITLQYNFKVRLRDRLLFLFSGRLQLVGVVWTWDEAPPVAYDVMQYAINPRTYVQAPDGIR
jgi:hypothetical protein